MMSCNPIKALPAGINLMRVVFKKEEDIAGIRSSILLVLLLLLHGLPHFEGNDSLKLGKCIL